MCSGSQEPRGAGPPNIRCRLARCRREPAPPPLLSGSRRRVGKGDWLSWLFGSICGVMLAREVWGGGVRQIQVRGTPSRRVGERARLPSQGSSGFCLFFSTFVGSAERPAKKVVLPTHRCGHEGRERSRTATLSSRPSRQTMRKGWTLSTRAADVAPNPVFVGQGLTIIGIVKAVCGKGDVTGMAEEEEERMCIVMSSVSACARGGGTVTLRCPRDPAAVTPWAVIQLLADRRTASRKLSNAFLAPMSSDYLQEEAPPLPINTRCSARDAR